jgi:hypothetical protein
VRIHFAPQSGGKGGKSMNSLETVSSFGGIDADTDALLDQCFEDHEAYQETRDHSKFLVLGRKGSGKTAIFRKFVTSQRHDVFTFGHTFIDYPWHHHDKQAAIGVPEEERYVHSWRYLILMTLAKILLNQDNSQPWCEGCFEDLRRLERFVTDSYGTRDPDVTQVFSPTRALKFRSSFEIPLAGLTVTLSKGEVPLNQLPTIIQEVNRNLTNAIVATLNPVFNYYVCFDQLDLGFTPNDQTFRNRLIGLILAARDLKIRAAESGKKFSALVFLRDDIYQALRFEDKNKVTEAYAARIEWDTPRTIHKLKDLMERRFAAVLGVDQKGAWERVFDENEQMPGRQAKYQHMLDRTFLRPRDMIKFCNEALSAFKKRPCTEERERFSNRDVNVARNEYSQYFLKELDDEIFKHIPNYEAYIEVLKSLDSLQFTRDDLDRACSDRAMILPKGFDARTMLNDLFEFSLIGCYSPGGGGYGGSEYIWRYRDPRSRFNEAAASYRIHPGLKEVLGLKKFIRSG